MDHYRERGKVDPDYASYNSAVELNEEEDKKENLNKIRKIIEEQYTREIVERQDQIEHIEMQICKVRKLLHLLRYALIMSYYKKKELEYGEDEASTSESFIIPDKQNRIHPAIKKLLGKNIQNLDHLNVKDKRKSNSRLVSQRLTESLSSLPDSKRIKLDVDVQNNEKIVGEAHSTSIHSENNLDYVRSRKKTKYRVVVGNISKWMPSSEDDILTHKWMVYVRGPKDMPDVSHFVDKVVYYLHPSYKPHDVVEVCESPFHLSRRGWGEFPVRVQIFFKVTLNKPIDVVHNIKLDKTYTGRQTLGNETIVDVFLYDGNNDCKELDLGINYFPGEIDVQDIKVEEIDIKVEDCELMDVTSAETEHDYCFENNEESIEYSEESHLDHSYALPLSHEGLPKPIQEKIEQDESNKLIFGLDTYCHEENEKHNKTAITANNFKQLIRLNRKDIKFNNTKIIVFGKKMEGSFLTTFGKLIQAPARDTTANKSFQITLPKSRMKNMGEALPFLFKRLPLCTDLATNINYKRIYPFTASSLKEYVSWNVGKRRSSEWSRAKIIKKILLSEQIHGIESWNTKAILMYGRSHDYTPYVSYGLFNRESEEKLLLTNCYSHSISNNLKRNFAIDEEDVTVNVDSDSEVTSPKNTEALIDITNPHSKMERCYVRQTALSCGVILKPEEIVEGVKVNGAETMILEAVKCLAENLIRRAFNHKVCTRTFSPNNSAINSKDVQVAISERAELIDLLQYTSEKRNDFLL